MWCWTQGIKPWRSVLLNFLAQDFNKELVCFLASVRKKKKKGLLETSDYCYSLNNLVVYHKQSIFSQRSPLLNAECAKQKVTSLHEAETFSSFLISWRPGKMINYIWSIYSRWCVLNVDALFYLAEIYRPFILTLKYILSY